MPEDDILAENIRLRQELEALRSLLQRQTTESGAPILSEPGRSEKDASGQGVSRDEVLKPKHSYEKEIDEPQQIEDALTREADCYSYSTSSCSELQKKQTFAWSWQDESGIWREYDPDICEVLLQLSMTVPTLHVGIVWIFWNE